jgi:hypothetical protein
LVAVAGVVDPGVARADQECVTSSFVITATFGLRFSDGIAQRDVSPLLIDAALGQADCLCDPPDVIVTIRVTVSTLPPQNVVPLEVWVGSHCDLPVNRAGNSTICKMLPTQLTSLDFSTGSTQELALQPISVRDLVDPSGAAPDRCAAGNFKNSLWILFNPANAQPDLCTVTLPMKTSTPDAPIGLAASAGPGSVTLTWQNPPSSGEQPIGYQVLCADENGGLIPSLDRFAESQIYDTCTAAGIVERRVLSSDGESNDAFGGKPPLVSTVGPAPFANLERKFICTGAILPAQATATIDGLAPGKRFSFVVVGTDLVGNPAPSEVVTAVPLEPSPMGGCGCAVGERAREPALLAIVLSLFVLALGRRAVISR